jgi:hypothetical protein
VFTQRQIRRERDEAHLLKRNFYGTLRTENIGAIDQPDSKRRLINGVIMHGEQFLSPERRHEPITYYGPSSGIGLVLKDRDSPPRRVGVIGLGSGTLAAYGRKGDVFHFYDINPQVVEIARHEFTYLQDSPAVVEISLGDARLSLEREPAQSFDVLAIDAFSSDSIPIHLMTIEAMAVFLKHMKPDGVIAYHVSNRFFELPPVVKQIAEAHGLHWALIVDSGEDPDLSRSDWVLVTRSSTLLEAPELAAETEQPTNIPGLRVWTDDDHNLFQVFRWHQ